MEPSAVELVCPESTREEITEIYHDVYQLQRSLGKSPYDEEMEEEHHHQDILYSIKECLKHKWRREGLSWLPNGAPSHDPQATTAPGTTPPMTGSGI